MTNVEHPRSVRSFVLRGGRITVAQRRALEDYWARYGIESNGALDLDQVFGRRARRVVEIGFGHGENILALAALSPETDFLGIEVHRAGIGKLLLEAAALDLQNLRVLCRDAVDVLGGQLADSSVDELLIFFPDPWPKKRHHKRRLIQDGFVELAARRLRPGGMLRVATDWQDYAEQMLDVLTRSPLLANDEPAGGFCPRSATRPLTHFEQRGARLGHDVWDLAFRRRAAG
ncbi:MAG: tRNA (guanosine(46)-N7)-methyltransferase TrmB [Steroidobacteraceae bacterium]